MEKSVSLTDFQECSTPSEGSKWNWKKKRNKSFGTLLTLDDLSHLPFDRDSMTPLSYDLDNPAGTSDSSFQQLSLLSQFEIRLGIEVEETLRRAAEHVGGDRAASLEDLYHNVCIRIEDSVRDKLHASEPDRDIPEYYFQLLAEFFADSAYGSAMVAQFHRYWMSLWSHEIFPAVFALLFGKWLFLNLPLASTPLASHVIVYISGVNRVLWNDVQSDRRVFRTVFNQLMTVVASEELQLRLPPRLRLDLQNLCFRFYFHYEDPTATRAFLASLPDVANPQSYALRHGGHDWHSKSPSTADSVDGNSSIESVDTEDVKPGAVPLGGSPSSTPQCLTTLPSVTEPHAGIRHSSGPTKRARLLGKSATSGGGPDLLQEGGSPTTITTPTAAGRGMGNRAPQQLVRSHSESAKPISRSRVSGSVLGGDDVFPGPDASQSQVALARACNEFVCEVIATLRNISKESSLLRYLRNVLHLSGLPLSASTASRLQAALYKYITPGGPLYPTRRVRHTARQVMDELFPGGKFARTLVSTLFRLTHPLQWPRSLLYWCLTIVLARMVLLVETTPVMGVLFRLSANVIRGGLNCLGCRRVVAVVEGFYNVHVGGLKDRRERRLAQSHSSSTAPPSPPKAPSQQPLITSWSSAANGAMQEAVPAGGATLPRISAPSANNRSDATWKQFLPKSADASPVPGLELSPMPGRAADGGAIAQ